MTTPPDLRVGITCRDDREALELCLESLHATISDVEHEVVVADAGSTDGSVDVARAAGARVVTVDWSQAESLNHLLLTSRARYTLLLHSDVVLLDPTWYPRVREALTGGIALVAPEDTGLGPHLRASYGAGNPESSFLFWDTTRARRLCVADLRRLPHRLRVGLPLRVLDLGDRHVTHRIPAALRRRGLGWRPLEVLASPEVEPWFTGSPPPGANWDPAWGRLAYGFGNFYALDGVLTHYHQWYTRFSTRSRDELNDDGVPVRFLVEAAERFRADYRRGTVRVPAAKR